MCKLFINGSCKNAGIHRYKYSGKTTILVDAHSSEQKAREDHSSGQTDETGNNEKTIEELSDLSAGHRMHDYLHTIHIPMHAYVKCEEELFIPTFVRNNVGITCRYYSDKPQRRAIMSE